ncbi:hypothetical protein IFM89_007142 [Coptis chinensis]|uniref:CUE domain-containing protein n=1 Tax=Coptis chinensis TaxID=261450 RepID=A0A835HCS9_9MAGN|nr:hypothetical protein IFM89_007142 [Coptis chinensis]
MMNLSRKGFPNNVTLNTGIKATTLNSNAVEFVPFSLRSTPGSTSPGEASKMGHFGTSGKAVEHAISDDSKISTVEFLASQFPGFAAESLVEVYYANGCDLNLTIEMLTQLELQVVVGFNQNLNSKTLSAPSLSAFDFPALLESDSQNGLEKYAGDNLQQSTNPYRSVDKDNIFFFKTGS